MSPNLASKHSWAITQLFQVQEELEQVFSILLHDDYGILIQVFMENEVHDAEYK